ncbi:MAG: hypothetical protein Q7R66_00930 [Undibacterium sp.]|nr:hypothetical protein [Undibacterium sp.]MDO8650741.1 hypothetical protein [Undibacterium sp.]
MPNSLRAVPDMRNGCQRAGLSPFEFIELADQTGVVLNPIL